MDTRTDVAIIGGGPGGLTAALTLGRAGRKVVVFDDNKGRNFPTEHMMNFPSRDGTPPLKFREQIKSDLLKYPEVSFKNERVNDIRKLERGFLLNGSVEASKILLAHGVTDILPDIYGLREAWGKNVFHCPYCHGHEFKSKKIGVIVDIPHYADHMIPLLLGLSSDVTVFTNSNAVEIPAQLKKYIVYHPERVRSFTDGKVELEDGKTVPINGLVIRPPQRLSTDLGVKLGCELTETGHYKVDSESMTNVPGVYAAGDVVDPRQSVLNACAYGQKAGAFMNFAILRERFI
jgi:thioredoxin reductase